MLLKLLNEDHKWEIWDGIQHITTERVKFKIKESEEEGAPDTLAVQGEQGLWSNLRAGFGTDVILIDAENPSLSGLILGKEVRGTAIYADMADGEFHRFYFVKQGYLLSESGKTIEGFNTH